MSRELMQKALDALNAGIAISPGSWIHDEMGKALAAPQPAQPERLEQPAQQEQPAQPVSESAKWKQGSLVTVTQDEYPALGGLFVQFWAGDGVAARVYANDHETLRRRCEAIASTQPAQEPYTYASTQATNCASCGKHKHTPLRIDAMGGYVCLTCVDKKLGSLLGEFGCPEPEQPAPAQKPVAWVNQENLISAIKE